MSKLCGILPISVVFFSDFALATINRNWYFVFKIVLSYHKKKNDLVIEKTFAFRGMDKCCRQLSMLEQIIGTSKPTGTS